MNALPTSANNAPELAVILSFREAFDEVSRTIGALQRQTAARQMEIVLVAPSRTLAHIDEAALQVFNSWQFVEVSRGAHGAMYAAGIRRARAPLVVLSEDHSFPAPNWGATLIQAHRKGDFAAVGPALRNGNPQTYISWADFYIAYGKWAVPIESQQIDFLPGHNSSYRAELLRAYGERLDAMLESEVVMHWDMRARGLNFWLEGSTYTEHLNFATRRAWIGATLYAGRLFGAERAKAWGLAKRALYILGAPLIPLVRFGRIHQDVMRAKLPLLFRWKLYAYILFGLGVDAVGQGLGYGLGMGEHRQESMHYEFRRERFL